MRYLTLQQFLVLVGAMPMIVESFGVVSSNTMTRTKTSALFSSPTESACSSSSLMWKVDAFASYQVF